MKIKPVCEFLESLEDRNTAQSFLDWLMSEVDDDRCALEGDDFVLMENSFRRLKDKLNVTSI